MNHFQLLLDNDLLRVHCKFFTWVPRLMGQTRSAYENVSYLQGLVKTRVSSRSKNRKFCYDFSVFFLYIDSFNPKVSDGSMSAKLDLVPNYCNDSS